MRERFMDYSVIITVFNEEDSIQPTYAAVRAVMVGLGRPYEIVFIDDGSTDKTLERLRGLQKQGAGDLVVIALAKNTGKAEASQAGFDHARGDIFITIDGDGQEEPSDIPRLLDKLTEGYDVVYGWRWQRQDSFRKKAVSCIAGVVRNILSGNKIHDVGCPLRVCRKKDLKGIRLSKGLHRFFSMIMEKKGFRVTEVKVTHYPRTHGVSKYGTWDRLVEGTADLLRISFTDIDQLMAGERKYRIREIYRNEKSVN